MILIAPQKLLDYVKDTLPFKKSDKIKTGFKPVLVLYVKNDIGKKVKEMSLEEKINFFESKDLPKKIIRYEYVRYNPSEKICILNSTSDPRIAVTEDGFPKDVVYWVSAKKKDKINFEKKGFGDGYVCNISEGEKLCMTRRPGKNVSEDTEGGEEENEAPFGSSKKNKDNKENHCAVTLQLSKDSLDYLKTASKLGYEDKDGKKVQKELTGEFKLKKDKGKYIINLIKDSIHSGEEENVNVKATRVNFHSHPEQAYIRHKVKLGWPSVTDFLGYHTLGENTIAHLVAGIEGLYILSFSKYWGERLKKISRSFITKNYEIRYTKNYTPQKFVKKVNSILYKGYPIFYVQFFTWKELDTKNGKPFFVNFPSIKDACPITPENLNIHRKIHN